MSANQQESIKWSVNSQNENGVKTCLRSRMPGVGFETTPPFGDQNTRYHLDGKEVSPSIESGALHRSAILTAHKPP